MTQAGTSQKTGYAEPMLAECWVSVADDGPTFSRTSDQILMSKDGPRTERITIFMMADS